MALKKRTQNGEGKDLTQSKVYIVADWIWRIFVINTLTLVTCIGVITILPAFVSAFRTFKSCKEEDETNYIRAYYRNFAYCFKDTVGVGLVVLFIFAMFAYAYVFYSEMIDGLRADGGYTGMLNLYSVLLALTIFFLMIVLFGLIQIPMVSTYFHFRFFDKLKFSFYMGFRYIGLSMLEFVIIVLDILLLALMPIYALFGFFSIPILLIYLVSRKCYWITAQKQNYNDEEQDKYDMQGKTAPRETYEDNPIDEKEKELEEINNLIMGEKKNDKTRNR